MTLLVRLKEGHTVEVIRRLASEFTRATSIQVRLDVVPEGQAHDELAGARPDVVTVPFWYLDELLDQGALRPLDESDPGWLGEARFVPQAVEALTRGGVCWAAPHTLTGGVLTYRTDVLERLGMAPPTSTGEVLEVARAARDEGSGMHGLVARASPEFSSLETYAGWAWAAGTKILPDQGPPDPAEVWAGAGSLIETLHACAPADLVRRSYSEVGDLMSTGRAAQLFDTSAWGFFLEDPRLSAVAGRVGYTTVRGPYGPAQFLYAEGLGVTSWSERPDEATAFVRWRHSPAVVEAEARMVGRVDLPRVDLWETDWYQELLERRGLADYMGTVRRAWEEADARHVAKRPDFVRQARRLMEDISESVSTGRPLAGRHVAEVPER